MLQRTAWKFLLVPTVIIVLFGIGDVVRGTDADPAIVEGLTGLTVDEITAASPEAADVIDALTRAQGMVLVWFGIALTAIVWFASAPGSGGRGGRCGSYRCGRWRSQSSSWSRTDPKERPFPHPWCQASCSSPTAPSGWR